MWLYLSSRSLCRRLLLLVGWVALVGSLPSLQADGPQDNIPAEVRRIPKAGIAVPADRAAAMQKSLQSLQQKLQQLSESRAALVRPLLPDVMIFERAVRCALDYDEFFDAKDLDKADRLLEVGHQRADQLLTGTPEWPSQKGLVVRGYISRIDHTVQPYGLVIPETYDTEHSVPTRCDIWFHGRGETLSEVNFLAERMQSTGQFAPANTIVLHPYGRYCNAFKFAGEVDVLEALQDVQSRYRIDEDRISVRGFSMGGAACWQFAVHYPDMWFAANPGAGFSETPRFLNVFQQEKLQPMPWEQTLWNLYDCDKYAVNLQHCPTIAYSGEVDKQKQAADVMEEALLKEGIRLRHIIGAGMGHKYDDLSKQIVEAGMSSLAKKGRDTLPMNVQFAMHTLRYNRLHWLTVDELGQHWKPARISARVMQNGADKDSAEPLVIGVECHNITAFSVDFPAGAFPVTANGAEQTAIKVQIGPMNPSGDALHANSPAANAEVGRTVLLVDGPWSDGSLSFRVRFDESGTWVLGARPESLRKRHGLQGPVDDAFMDSFVFVRPTGAAANAALGKWADDELTRAIEHWRRHFRGDARVITDTELTDELIESANLVLWGDPQSNVVLAKIADKLPISWTGETIAVGSQSYQSANHAPILIYPNPLNPNRYVVLNSSFTFRDYAYLNNARQVPMLPDWAIINLDTPPNSVWPGKIVAADFFDEQWQLK